MFILIKKRWGFVHINAMDIVFLMDPSTDLNDFIGDDQDYAISIFRMHVALLREVICLNEFIPLTVNSVE